MIFTLLETHLKNVRYSQQWKCSKRTCLLASAAVRCAAVALKKNGDACAES